MTLIRRRIPGKSLGLDTNKYGIMTQEATLSKEYLGIMKKSFLYSRITRDVAPQETCIVADAEFGKKRKNKTTTTCGEDLRLTIDNFHLQDLVEGVALIALIILTSTCSSFQTKKMQEKS
jgi:hypothetical protein